MKKDKLQAVSLLGRGREIVVKVGNEKFIKSITGKPLFASVNTVAKDGEYITGVEIDYYQNPRAIEVLDLDICPKTWGIPELVEHLTQSALVDMSDYCTLNVDFLALPR